MRSITRLLSLAGLNETPKLVPTDDEEDEEWDRRHARHQKIVQMIITAFKRISIDIDTEKVYYAEEFDREAHVILDDNECDLRLLTRLFKTGLAEQYTISANKHALMIEFKVSPLLDQAI